MTRHVLWLVGLSLGCSASYKLATARHTPCRTRDVKITDKVHTGTRKRWTAHCGRRSFECEAIAQGDYDVAYRCRPAER